MSKYLVIVESPTKARTITAILGKDYEVTSSMGHVVDLPAKSLSIDLEKGFTPKYRTIPGKEKIISQLRKKAEGKEAVYIATDPDREGEAIGWHIQDKLSKETKIFHRVVFHEITDTALKEAFAHPGKIDANKVNAQVARRVLDRIVGYFLSPLLWKKIVRGLSAGRVQSVALKFIVEREKEVQAFVPKTTYGITAKFKAEGKEFEAELEKYKGHKAVFNSEKEAQDCIAQLNKEKFQVKDITKKQVSRKPSPPYTTSLMQQEAFNKLRFSSQKTMLLAQRLYEGVDIKEERTGLITYMRTDSFHISPKAKAELKEFVKHSYGEKYLPEKEPHYKEKKGAQAAHEAIRPSSIYRTPEKVAPYLEPDELKLYELIWRRFAAAYMKEALWESSKMIIASESGEFGSDGRKLLFDGFLKLMDRDEEEKNLPALAKGEAVAIENTAPQSHTTKPLPRFNDASLIKLMEEKGIGRPSTYAPTIDTLLRRDYVRREKGAFVPSELGIKVIGLLAGNFDTIVNEDFTASMEEQLDEVEDGKMEWRKVVEKFYPEFKENIDRAGKVVTKDVELVDKKCPQCGSQLAIKWSRRGKFLSCSTYPQCKYAESITTGISCPLCKQGQLLQRRNKRGQSFYGCTKFPECRFTITRLSDLEKSAPAPEKKPEEQA